MAELFDQIVDPRKEISLARNNSPYHRKFKQLTLSPLRTGWKQWPREFQRTVGKLSFHLEAQTPLHAAQRVKEDLEHRRGDFGEHIS
jgi:hypothetical protein